MASMVVSYLRKAKGRPPNYVFGVTLSHAVVWIFLYMLRFESGVGKNGAIAGVFVLCAMNGELVWNKASKTLQLKQEILVVHHNVFTHLLWAVVLSTSSLLVPNKGFFMVHVATCLLTCTLNLCFYQKPKDAKTWKQAMDESAECPFAAEARRKQYSQDEFENLRLSYHQD